MKYLEKSFTIAVRTPRPSSVFRLFNRYMPTENDRKRNKPHEYLNGGAMCQICGLAEEAKIHETD